jgi:hypothetical protein
MRRIRRALPVVVLAGLLAAIGVAVTGSGAAAYGAADQPLAQVEVSGNCDNPSFPFCANVVGTGGIWFWVELDANHTGDLSGAECGHTFSSGSGAGSISTTVQWIYSPAPIGVNVLDAADPSDTHGVTNWYVIFMPSGPPFSVPVQTGHYSWQPVNGVSLQTTVAP